MRAIPASLLISFMAVFSAIETAQADVAPWPQTGAASRTPTDISAQQRRRPRVRIYREYDNRGVIPSYFPGSNAVRDCSVRYVQEFRPSGTVIAPHMKCFWRQP